MIQRSTDRFQPGVPRRRGRPALLGGALALGLALWVVLAACGGAPETSGSSPAPSSPVTPAPGATAGPTSTASPSSGPPSGSPPVTPSGTRFPSPSPSTLPSPSCPSDNALRSWYYVPGESHGRPAIPDDAARLLHKNGGRYLGDTGEKVVYLTFDEGYENGFTGRILDALRDAGVEATFFVTGAYVRGNPALVRRMADEGHIVANHTDSHPSLPSLARDRTAFAREIRATEKAFAKATGHSMARLLRPPMGEYSALSMCRTQRLGYATVFWSFAHRDWLVDDQPPVALTLERILAGSHKGAIYLLHAVSRSNAEALPRAIAGLRAQGYRIGALTELR
ncbi:MAG: polysaccharide deacetylase family protein [Thermoleophilia bacterium]